MPVDDTFTAQLWIAKADAPWHFVTLPQELSDRVADQVPKRPGFGSVRVEATIGSTTWETSLFPDSKAGAYVLPVKRAVRDREKLVAGDELMVKLSLAES